MSNDELQKLLDDEKAFEEYFLKIKGVKELGESFSQLMESLKTQAEENLKSKEEIDKLYNEYLDVRKEYEELKGTSSLIFNLDLLIIHFRTRARDYDETKFRKYYKCSQ